MPPGGFGQWIPIFAGGFEQVEGADDIGLNECARPVYGPVDMRFGREIQDCPGLMPGQQAGHQRAVANVAVYEYVPRVGFQ